MGRESRRDKTIIEQLSHEIAILKRHKFAERSEQIGPAQGSLLDDLLNTDLEAIDPELKSLRPAPAPDEARQQPKRAVTNAVCTYRHSSRAGVHRVCLRLTASTHRRRCQRETGLHAGFVPC
ncbi:hypothetical protein [Pseudomonas sp. MWU16-30317]|nr:hypothetical protein [Pseudomonas sp. MWU16-30317]